MEPTKQRLTKVKFSVIQGSGPNFVLLSEMYFNALGVEAPEVLIWKMLGGKEQTRQDEQTTDEDVEEAEELAARIAARNVQRATDVQSAENISNQFVDDQESSGNSSSDRRSPQPQQHKMDERLEPIAYILQQLRSTQIKLLQLGRDHNHLNGVNEDLVSEIWVLSAEIGTAVGMIRDQAEELREREERGLRRKYHLGVTQELMTLLPKVNKPPQQLPIVMGADVVVEIASPRLGLVELYEPPATYSDHESSPPYMPDAQLEGQETAED